MSEYGVGGANSEIPLARLNARGELEYTQPVLDAFEQMLNKYPESASAGEITMADPNHLFAVELKSRGDDKLWNRTYYTPRLSRDPSDPIKFETNLRMSLSREFWKSGLTAYYYPEDTFNPPQVVKVGLKGATEKAQLDYFSPDHLAVVWGIDGKVGKISFESDTDTGLLRRDDLNILYTNEADRVTVPMSDDPDFQLEGSLDYNKNIVVRTLGGGRINGYKIKSEVTKEDQKEILDQMVTEELLNNPGTASVSEDIWKGIDILPTFGITRIPS